MELKHKAKQEQEGGQELDYSNLELEEQASKVNQEEVHTIWWSRDPEEPQAT